MQIIDRGVRMVLGLAALSLAGAVGYAATVSSGGYTNDFVAQPSAADWATISISGAAGDVTAAAALDSSVQNVSAATIGGGLTADAGNPPGALGTAVWSSTGYLQTRPTGVQAALLLCTLVNGLGVNASTVTISYDLSTSLPVAEEVDGQRAYYSLTGAAGSWVNIPAFSTAVPGRLTATLNIAWTSGTPLYVLWADDNGSGSPDSVFQIDNFSAQAVPASQIPASISAQPANVTVLERQPYSFTAAVIGYPQPSFQWFKNNNPIPGATSVTYSNTTATVGDNNATFFLRASNVANGVTSVVTSSTATLTVTPDTTAPTLAAVAASGGGVVQVTFSEPVTVLTATNLVNYRITNNAGTLAITNASLAADGSNVVLYTAAQTIGSTYTLIVSGVQDISAAGNVIALNSTLQFTAVSITSSDIGASSIPGSITAVSATGYNVSGSGSGIGGIGGTNDQITFAYQQKAGDFDVKVRVADFGGTDPWSEAAIMARDTVNPGSIFAAAVSAPIMTGCFFESRASLNAAATRSGNFPVSFPNVWVRLKRVGNLFTGYASADGSTWVQLGSVTLAVGSVNLGFAVTTHDATRAASAQFRDYSDTAPGAVVVTSVAFDSEPLSAAARTTPMVISEIMYKPGGINSSNLEYVELYNSNPFFEDISGYRLSGDVDFTFPSNTIVQAGAFIVVAKNPAVVQSAYGITGVLGPYSNSLPVKGTIRLRSDVGALLLEVNYSNDNPWPAAADATGHSLVLARASWGQGDPKAWDISDRRGGSPGRHEPVRIKSGLRSVVINEILAHTDLPQLDYIELYNYSTQAVDISGCYLSDAASTNKFRIPPATVLGPRSFISWDETQLGFALTHHGETIYFRSADNSQMLDAMQYESQENGVAFGRYPDGSGQFYRLTSLTPGTNNAAIRVDDIAINELMYGPISEEDDDQYIELYNQGTNTVDVGGWTFTSGIGFTFPANTLIPAGGYMVVAKNFTNLFAHYGNLTPANTIGNFAGKLSREGERVTLAKPDYDIGTNASGQLKTNVYYIVVDEVSYKGGGSWGKWANQGGSSLELIDARSNHRLAYSWGDSDETAKAAWTLVEHTGILDTGSVQGGGAIDRLEITMLGEGECLVDDVEVHSPIGSANLLPNPGFEPGLSSWAGTGNHPITLENTGRTGTKSIRIKAGGNGDTGANTVRSIVTPALAINQVASLKAYVKWQHGWPEITLRARGGYLEAYGRMSVPQNLGSPGAPNSISRSNGPPALYGVIHSPPLPQTGEAVVVTAGAQDMNGVTNVTLWWRVDSATPPAYTALAMNDDGIAGDAVANDGIFSGRIPAQASGTMVSFYVEATDSLGAKSQFPINPVPQRECLVRWGDPMPTSAFAAYRLWMSRANVNAYINRPALSNQDIDGTMVVGNNRIIYNVGSHYSNSPYHQGQNGSPETGSTHFSISLPEDNEYLGTATFNKVHAPGNGGFDDTTLQREQTAFWFARKMGLPYLYRRYVAMYVNGNRKGGANALQEDTQRPGGDMIDEWFEDEPVGRLYKLQPWFEFQNDFTTLTGGAGAAFDNKLWCTLTRNLSTNLHKITRYRQNYLARSADKTANDYTNVIALIEAANVPTTSPAYWANMSGMIDVEEWTGIWAVEHAVGNWDSFGNRNSQNMYGYKPDHGKWKLMIWDLNIVLGSSAGPDTPSAGNIFQYQNGQDPVGMGNLNAYPPMRRAWWRWYKELTASPNAPMYKADPILDAKYAAFRASGVNPLDPSSIKSFIATARANISNEVIKVDLNNFNVTAPSITAVSNLITVSGVAGLDVFDIRINGASWPVTWTTISNWTATVPITNAALLRIAAFDRRGNLFGNTNSVTVNYAPAATPDPRGYIVFNEIMYNPPPTAVGSEFIELYNSHTNYTFDLSGWRVNGVDFTFPPGSYIAPRSFLILVKDRVAFNVAYGASLVIAGEYSGNLQGDGETLTLLRPGSVPGDEIVVDRVRYEGGLPYPLAAANTGSSLQLVDVAQDNARAGNWDARHVPAVYTDEVSTPARTNQGWQFVSIIGRMGGDKRLIIYLDTPNTVVVDDISLVSGTNAGQGQNFIVNGDFETPLGAEWVVPTNMPGLRIINDIVHSGTGALMITQNWAGGIIARDLLQTMTAAPTNTELCTLSFWMYTTNVASSLLNMRVVSSTLSTNASIGISITASNYIPPQLVSPATNYVTPGAANQFTAVLPAFQTLWINEVQAENLSGLADNFGERDPWIEIYNPGTNDVSLDGLYLSSAYTNLTQWPFPTGLTIGAGQFKLVWCDAQVGQNTASSWHAGFRLTSGQGSVALSRLYNGQPQVLDYVNYKNLHADRSYGSFPDGQPFDRMEFYFVTPAGTNDGRSAPLNVFINEWMAANTSIIADPADSKFSDWFEVYNPTTNTVDLAGYYFTDALTNKTKFHFTAAGTHTIEPGGHLLVWADSDTGQNTSNRIDAHVSFKLSKSGGQIGIFSADGTLVDAVSYSTGLVNIAEGRYPDGSSSIYFLTNPTPRAANFMAGAPNTAPVLAPVGNRMIYLGQSVIFTATATDSDVPAQPLGFTLEPGAPAGAILSSTGDFSWTPSAVGSYTMTLTVRDTASPPLSDSETFTVDVLGVPRFQNYSVSGGTLTLAWGSHAGQLYRIEYKQDLSAPTWSFFQDVPATGSSTSVAIDIGAIGQRFYRITVIQ